MLCGLEEPLSANPMLHALNEQTGSIDLAEFACKELNRYCFVWMGGWNESDLALQRLVSGIIEQSNAPAMLLAAWAVPASDTPRPNRVLRVSAEMMHQARLQEGWDIRYGDELSIATTPVKTGELSSRGPWADRMTDRDRIDRRTVILTGEALAALDPLDVAPLPTIRRLGFRTPLTPSAEFLDWLAAHRVAIIYRKNDDLGRPGAVVISPQRVGVSDLVLEGIVDKILSGPAAQNVWRCGPSRG